MPTQQTERPDIKGWGADVNPKDRPGYPKERTPPRFTPANMPEPAFQEQKVRKFHSNERPTISPIFGTTVPPRGLSGVLRGSAFKFSENDIRHWLILLFADRVDMVEGIIEDIGRGHIPNFAAEMGLKSEFKFNKERLVKVAVVTTAVFATAFLFLKKDNKPKKLFSFA